MPNGKSLLALARALSTTVEELSGVSVPRKPPSVARENIKGALDDFYARVEDIIGDVNGPGLRPIPLISVTSAGLAETFTDQGYPVGGSDEKLDRPPNLTDPNAYGLRVEGDSMSPRLMPGDIVVASPNSTFANADICVVKTVKNDVFIRKLLERENHYLLQAINPAFEPISLPKSETRFIHKVVWIKPK